ncbi:hypothetical protein FACS1894110_26250 [Spirochaetia bacterium]|nr:hypothetical protein FACS1894110_26250 [Spirochaetia bacterium]
MKKKSLVLGTIALLLTAIVFLGCPGAGEPGPAGTSGNTVTGPVGYTPAADIATAQALFDSGVDKVYLTTTDAATTKLTIESGKTFLVLKGVSVTGGTGFGFEVEAGGTFLISGTVDIDNAEGVVDGTLTVQDGGVLSANTGKTLTVNDGAAVTIKDGGTLSALAAIDAAAADGVILAHYIGGLTKSAADSVVGGRITFEDDAWLNVTAAEAIDTIGFAAHKKLIASDAVTSTSTFPASGTGYVLKVGAASVGLAVPAVPAGDELIIAANSTIDAALPVTGTLTIETGKTLTTAATVKIPTLLAAASRIVVNGTLALVAGSDPITSAVAGGKIVVDGGNFNIATSNGSPARTITADIELTNSSELKVTGSVGANTTTLAGLTSSDDSRVELVGYSTSTASDLVLGANATINGDLVLSGDSGSNNFIVHLTVAAGKKLTFGGTLSWVGSANSTVIGGDQTATIDLKVGAIITGGHLNGTGVASKFTVPADTAPSGTVGADTTVTYDSGVDWI